MITAIFAPDTVAGAAVDMDSSIGDMMATCLGEVRRHHRGQKEIQITCVKLIGGVHEEVLRVSANCMPWTKNAPTCVSTERARLQVERPANPRSLQPFHAQGTTPKTNLGLPQSSAKLRVVWCKTASPLHLTRSSQVLPFPRPVRVLWRFRLVGREAWTCGESSKRHMRTTSME